MQFTSHNAELQYQQLKNNNIEVAKSIYSYVKEQMIHLNHRTTASTLIMDEYTPKRKSKKNDLHSFQLQAVQEMIM